MYILGLNNACFHWVIYFIYFLGFGVSSLLTQGIESLNANEGSWQSVIDLFKDEWVIQDVHVKHYSKNKHTTNNLVDVPKSDMNEIGLQAACCTWSSPPTVLSSLVETPES